MLYMYELFSIALSATPGSDLQAVRMMLQNLEISKIELRDESSTGKLLMQNICWFFYFFFFLNFNFFPTDIVPYTFERKLEKIVIPHGTELLEMKRKYLTIIEIYIRRLAEKSVLNRRSNSINPEHYTKFGKKIQITFKL